MFKIKTSQRLFTSFAAFCVGVVSYAAELRESVCYIKESKNTSLNCDNVANALQNKSFFSAARKVRDYAGGESHGSGFVIKDDKGKLIVVTNKHVVDDAKYVDLTFEVNGAEVKYARCPVVFVSKNVDIALVNFPSNEVNVPALKFNKDKIKDGSDVWTAGYPALGDKPSWQLGKGVMSNNSVKDEFFGNVDSVAVYQHTAQVDPGSSGGPLLVKDKSGDFVVIGINTWKASYRENTNFSIPIRYYNSVATNDEIAASTTVNKSNDVEETAKQFLEEVKKKDADLSSYVANEMLFDMDESAVSALIDNASETRKIELRTKAPVPVMKSIVGEFVFNKVKKIEEVEYSATVKDGDNYKSTYLYKGKEIEVNWKESSDGYKIVSSSSSPEEIERAGESKVIYSQEWSKYFEVGFSKGLSEIYGKKFDASFMVVPVKYFLYGYRLEMGHIVKHKFDQLPETNYYGEVIGGDTTYMKEEEPFLGLAIRLGGQCPFNLAPRGKVFITPYVIGDVGWVISGSADFEAALHTGVRLGYTTKKSNAVFVGAECNFKRMMSSGFESSGDDDGCDFEKRRYFTVSIGYGF